MSGNCDRALPVARLELAGITHAYGRKPVLNGVDLSIAPGEILCLLGPSGCGKSTTLRIAAGLETVQNGQVMIDGIEVASPDHFIPPERRSVGLMFQDLALFPHLTVRDNVAFGLGREKNAETRRGIAQALLNRVGLERYAAQYPHTLSGGEQQRVALARALAPEPSVLLLDEPFSSLDRRLREQVRDETLALLAEHAVATLLVTHDAEEALFMADRIAVMQKGRIVQVGAGAELYDHPSNAFVARFLGEVNSFTARVTKGGLETPLGRLATTLADGSEAEALVRPEGLTLLRNGAAGDAAAAKVETVHLLGASSLIRVRMDGFQGTLLLRMSHRDVPQVDETVRIRLDPSQCFVFPAKQEA